MLTLLSLYLGTLTHRVAIDLDMDQRLDATYHTNTEAYPNCVPDVQFVSSSSGKGEVKKRSSGSQLVSIGRFVLLTFSLYASI